MAKSRRKALPPLGLGGAGYRDPIAELGSPSVSADTPGATITMPMDSAMAAEQALGSDAQSMSSAELAAWLDAHGLAYRWTLPS